MKIVQGFYFLLLCIIVQKNIYAVPATQSWTTPVQLTQSNNVTSMVATAATSAGFMAVWGNDQGNGYYAFSVNGTTWTKGSISSAQGVIAQASEESYASDIFVAGNDDYFVVTWMDDSNNAWSSTTSNYGVTWSSAVRINPDSLTLNAGTDVFVAASNAGFVATMISDDANVYVSFSQNGKSWSAPTQVTDSGDVYLSNGKGGQSSVITRGFVSAIVINNSCTLSWMDTTDRTKAAYFSMINPFTTPTISWIIGVGYCESTSILSYQNDYYMNAVRVNQSGGFDGGTAFSIANEANNWGIFTNGCLNAPINNCVGPWVTANQTGFMSVWSNDGNPVWTFTDLGQFTWTDLTPILSSATTSVSAPMTVTGNTRGFVAAWRDNGDHLNAYVTFYATPINPTGTTFVQLLQQKYGPLL